MKIAFGFLLPCLLYFALHFLLPKQKAIRSNQSGLVSVFVSFVIALISSGVVFYTVVTAPHWPGNTQVVWSGVEVAGQPLLIGGARAEAIVGWPNESFSPSLEITAVSDNKVKLTMADGGAFFFDRTSKCFLNGTLISGEGDRVRCDYKDEEQKSEFKIKVSHSAYYFWQQQIEILGGDDNARWATFPLPAILIKRERVYSLAEKMDGYAEDSIRSDAAKMLKLEKWSAPLSLLLTRDGEILILGPEVQHKECELPCRLDAYWPHRVLHFEVTKDGDKLAMNFLPPRQIASPLLPKKSDDSEWESLTVTRNPVPNDRAFYLPLGNKLDLHAPLDFKNHSSGLPVFAAPSATINEQKTLPYSPPNRPPQEAKDNSSEKKVTSALSVESAPYSFTFLTINDLPDYWLIAGLLLLCLICYGTGLSVAYRRMPDDLTRWVIYGIVAVIWNLLMFRLLLSFRYAADPTSLDALAVKGVTTAFVGAMVIPSLILLFVRLRRDLFARPEEWKTRKRILLGTTFHLFLLIFFGWYASWKTKDIWPNAPVHPFSTLDLISWVIILCASLYLFLMIFIIYRISSKPSAAQEKAMNFFSWPLRVIEWMAKRGYRIWTLASNMKPWSWSQRIKFFFQAAGFALVFAFVVPFLIGHFTKVVSKVVAADTFVHDVVMPLAWYWPLAIILLVGKSVFLPGTKQLSIVRDYRNADLRRMLGRVFVIVLVSVGACVFLLPVAIGDAGSIMCILAVMIPLATIMMMSPPRRWGAIVALTLVLCFATVTYVFFNIWNISPYLPTVAATRLLIFKESNIQHYIPFETRDRRQKLRDGIQHTWENEAMVHEGGYLGVGFGNALTRNSQVRQDTIQYDSVFSFFIVGEYGLLGGICLLLLYSLPLAFIIVGGRLRFDFGYAVAALVASSFLFEALTHAGMNLNLLPFTGRDLPLLTVNSFTDLLRWTILFCFFVQAILYRHKGRKVLSTDSLITPAQNDTAVSVSAEPLNRYVPAVALLSLIPVVALTAILWSGVKIKRDKTLDAKFSWRVILDDIEVWINKKWIYASDKDQTLKFDSSIGEPPKLYKEELDRFNALPIEERKEQSSLDKHQDLLTNMSSLKVYDQLLNALRMESRAGQDRQRESLFRLLPPRMQYDDSGQLKEVEGYRVVPNRAFNSELSFKTGLTGDDFPHVNLSDGTPLIGPAWVMGRWELRYNSSLSIPWTAHLLSALKAEWDRLGKDEATKRYGTLSLHSELQEAADKFIAEKGRKLHDEILKTSDSKEKFPPPAALAVVSLPTGEVRAISGWPRMSASRYWTNNGAEWIPPYDWVEREAPQELRALYGNDHNFDLMAMGSTTKPLWASAVLKIHPNLDLKTRGDGQGKESKVFGIKVPGTGWWVGKSTDLIDFTDYLAKSDNGYQVRLGFLGLAEKEGGGVVSNGKSDSEKEQLNGKKHELPQFIPQINISHNEMTTMGQLKDTALAKQLFNMYSIGSERGYFDHRLSFWTENTEHDLKPPVDKERGEDARAVEIFKPISPVAVNLNFDQPMTPREYVSLLLGGGANEWANVDFAAAFGTCVTGHAVHAHIVRNQESSKLKELELKEPELKELEKLTGIAREVRKGLRAVVIKDGTAYIPELTEALAPYIQAGYSIYAKTGTLADGAEETEKNNKRNISRIVLAIIEWVDEAQGKVKSGVVLSIVVQHAPHKTATEWLADFLSKNKIKSLLSDQT